MTEASEAFTPGSVQPLSAAQKTQWALGQVRQIAAGTLAPDGRLRPAGVQDSHWQLSVRSIEKPGSFKALGMRHTLTLIAGEFAQLMFEGQSRGLEPLRPLKIETADAIEVSQPTEELLVLHLANSPQHVRATVRIVELSRKHDQHLFDGQLGVLLQGKATMSDASGRQVDLQLRDTVYGGDAAQVQLRGRGFLAVVSMDPAD